VSAVLFDLNGTLVDDVPRATRCTSAVLTGVGLPSVSREEFRDAFRLPLTDFFASLGVPDGGLEQAVTDWSAAMASEPAPLMPRAREVLSQLAALGIPTGVISAAGCDAVHADLTHHGLRDLLAHVRCGVADKAALLRDEVAAARGAVIYVGDTEYDVVSAQDAGAWPVAVSAGYTDHQRLQALRPWRLLPSLDGLLADGFWD